MVSYSPPDIPVEYSPILSTTSFRSARVPSTARATSDVDVRVPKPVSTSGQRIVVLRRSAPGAGRGGIEGDVNDRGDGDEDGKSRQFLKQRQTLKPSSAPYSLSLNNSLSTRSRAPTMFFEQEKAAPEVRRTI